MRNSVESRSRYRLHLEHLEQRLAPGDALLGLLYPATSVEARGTRSRALSGLHSQLQLPLMEDDAVIGSPIIVETSLPRLRQLARSKVETQGGFEDSGRGVTAPADLQKATASRSPQVGDGVDATTARMGAASFGAMVGSSSLGRGLSITPKQAVGAGDGMQIRPHTNGSAPAAKTGERGRPSLAFESNEGQTDSRVDFIARAADYTAFVTPTGAVFSIPNPVRSTPNAQSPAEMRKSGSSGGVAIHMDIVGAEPQAAAAREKLPGKVNYLVGNDPSQWRTNISRYGQVEYSDVYPGIDLVYYSNDQQLEYDFVVSPGADPNVIQLNFAGADGAEIDAAGNLVLHNHAQDFVQKAPYLYQETNGVREQVSGHFVLNRSASSDHSFDVSFAVGDYDTSRPLVIDPLALSYSTIFGVGNDDDIGLSFAMDAAGNYYSAGLTTSTHYPVTSGTFDEVYNGGLSDAFVTKISADGSQVVYSTYIGGATNDMAYAVAVDALGSAYITGQVDSPDLPITAGAVDETYNGGWDAYVAKLTPDGSALDYATYLGTPGDDIPSDIQVDQDGNAYVVGETNSAVFPTTSGAFQTTHAGGRDAFVTTLNATGTGLVYSTFVGGSGDDASYRTYVRAGEAYFVGQTSSTDFPITPGVFDPTPDGTVADGFVAKLSADGTQLEFATYLGGSGDDAVQAINLDADGNIYVTGNTKSGDFPTTPGSFSQTYSFEYTDGFVVKFDANAVNMLFGTYLGANNVDFPQDIVPDAAGFVWMAGWTKSSDFPTTPDAIDLSYNDIRDITLTKLDSQGDVVYSTYFGGNRTDGARGRMLVLGGNGDVNLGGWTDSSNYPTTPNALKRRNRAGIETYVTKFIEF